MDDFFTDYCPACERDTTHRVASDEDDILFDYAVECMNCHIVWEVEAPS